MLDHLSALFYSATHSWIYLLLLASTIIFLNNYSRQLFFFKAYNTLLGTYHVTCRELKQEHFDSMKNHKSADPRLREKGGLRILEIGPGPGYNYEFYPPKSEVTAVEVNPFFEEQFFKKQADHPHINMDRFVVGFAEDMKGVPDNSVDIVVSTMVLCSVGSVEGALKEIHRVLAPGGKYYFWEHIIEHEYRLVRYIQNIASHPLCMYQFVFAGCKLNRKSDEVIQRNDLGFSHIDQKRFRTPQKSGLHAICIFHSSHVKGIATK
ncbi:methyltransferase-like protein 7A [Daphnia pulex]|uniref:methyltransferase-like protein 7A n=1 Tax=Daphnia pulex TaxID=6669 RepID=UPI001EDCF5C5|nr:methyltransferase-like protein 7A [Daphnia pulex]XP_046639348.1 methyltransferase-like protein 7A [Daphnia pulicaria]